MIEQAEIMLLKYNTGQNKYLKLPSAHKIQV